jgi:2-phospho-L-lactate guanylyltransferase
MSDIWAIIPVKDARHSKQRLSALLGGEHRRLLALTMLEDVLDAVVPAMGAERCLIVTADEDAIAAAGRRGVRTTATGAHDGHTGAVTTAARMLADEGARGFMTMPGDIPRVTTDEVRALLAAHRAGRAFTIAPSHDELGSNGIVCTPWNAVPLRFGDNSFYPHLDAARRCGVEPTVMTLAGVALDIDTPEDVRRFMGAEPRRNTRTLRLLERLLPAGSEAGEGKMA